jgi:hypothetical protein
MTEFSFPCVNPSCAKRLIVSYYEAPTVKRAEGVARSLGWHRLSTGSWLCPRCMWSER